MLIQAAPPHRRARSAAWSYHFYPDEAWVDLTVQLPFAILLSEVQIQPHSASLTSKIAVQKLSDVDFSHLQVIIVNNLSHQRLKIFFLFSHTVSFLLLIIPWIPFFCWFHGYQ